MKSWSGPLAAFALILAATGCAAPIAGVKPMSSYANPVLDLDFPDPATLTTPSGTTYVYATQGNIGGTATLNIRVARSNDLVKWTLLGDALPTKPAWASKTQDFWAPHVHAADGRYFLY